MRPLGLPILLIGLSQGIAWAMAYPAFIDGIQSVAAFGPDKTGMPIIVLLPLIAVLVFLAALALFFSNFITLVVSMLAKWAGCRVEGRPKTRVFQLSALFTFLSITMLSLSLMLFPPDFLLSPLPSGKPYLIDQNKIHMFLWPLGILVITLALAIVNALIAVVVLRKAEAKTPTQ